MKWIQKNLKTLIYIAFLVPIITVAIVSISHVTKWYGLSNPVSWAIYLSIGIEIAALSSLAAISASMGRKVYFPFGIVTLIQFIGNIFFAYQYIDVNGQSFKDWVDLVDPIVSFLGVESGNVVSHKRFLALFAGGMLPLISLSFLHMLVKFEEEEKNKVSFVKTDEPNNLEIKIDPVEHKLDTPEIVEEVKEEKLSDIENQIDEIQKNKYKNLELVEDPTPVQEVTSVEVVESTPQPIQVEKRVLNYRNRNDGNRKRMEVTRIG